MKKNRNIDSYERTQMRSAFWFPFILVAVGIYIIVFEFPKFNELKYYNGKVIDYYERECLYINIKGYKQTFKWCSNNKDIFSSIKKGSNVEIWTKVKSNSILQYKQDDVLIVQYDRYSDLFIPIVIILVGIVMIPFVLIVRKRGSDYFED